MGHLDLAWDEPEPRTEDLAREGLRFQFLDLEQERTRLLANDVDF
jgi:hypothetical protein